MGRQDIHFYRGRPKLRMSIVPIEHVWKHEKHGNLRRGTWGDDAKVAQVPKPGYLEVNESNGPQRTKQLVMTMWLVGKTRCIGRARSDNASMERHDMHTEGGSWQVGLLYIQAVHLQYCINAIDS